jgi:hypothetical protein
MTMLRRGQKFLISSLLIGLLFVSACARPEPSRWEQVQQESRQEQISDISTAEPLPGGEFNQFFPTAPAGYERVYTQEKQGFAEAKLKQDGQDLAMLSVSDTATNPDAVTKFRESDQTIAGYPAAQIGSTATAILVGDRLQVKVQSRADTFTTADREAWLQQFDLNGLESLVK